VSARGTRVLWLDCDGRVLSRSSVYDAICVKRLCLSVSAWQLRTFYQFFSWSFNSSFI